MKIAIVGGKLQGIEATILAKKAGIKSVLIDKNPQAPASTLCDYFVCGDVCRYDKNVIESLKNVDVILPAMENLDVIDSIMSISENYSLPVAFDADAYKITMSKIKSDIKMMHKGIPLPKYFPEGEYPYILKPSCESGSTGVRKINNIDELNLFTERKNSLDFIIEEFIEGPSYSIEVVGKSGQYKVYQPTEIHMSNDYDCCRVTTPVKLSESEVSSLDDIGIRLANMVNLNGIMDVEVIERDGNFYVLEIDARIPSQTPLSVYFSNGENELLDLIENTIGIKTEIKPKMRRSDALKVVSYEQYKVFDGDIVNCGEKYMSDVYPLDLKESFLGSEMMISNWDHVIANSDYDKFTGIFILTGKTCEEVINKRLKMIKTLKDTLLSTNR